MQKKYLIWGIDPGTQHCGYSLIFFEKETFIIKTSGIITTKKNLSLSKKIHFIYSFLENLFDIYYDSSCETIFCIEDQFLGKNCNAYAVLSCLKGALLLLAEKKSCFIVEVSPSHAKKFLGSGAFNKETIKNILQKFFPSFNPAGYDESDALLLALVGFWNFTV